MSELIFVELKKKTLGDQKLIKYQVLRESKKKKNTFYKMEEEDYREMLEVIEEKIAQLPTKSRDSFEFLVRASTDEGWKTLQSYDKCSTFNDYLAYYEDRTKEGAKFYKTFDQFEIEIKYYQ